MEPPIGARRREPRSSVARAAGGLAGWTRTREPAFRHDRADDCRAQPVLSLGCLGVTAARHRRTVARHRQLGHHDGGQCLLLRRPRSGGGALSAAGFDQRQLWLGDRGGGDRLHGVSLHDPRTLSPRGARPRRPSAGRPFFAQRRRRLRRRHGRRDGAPRAPTAGAHVGGRAGSQPGTLRSDGHHRPAALSGLLLLEQRDRVDGRAASDRGGGSGRHARSGTRHSSSPCARSAPGDWSSDCSSRSR